jgi:hypothetical protein
MRNPLEAREPADTDQMLGADSRLAGEQSKQSGGESWVLVKQFNHRSKWYLKDYRRGDRPYRVEGGFKKAAGQASEVPGKEKVQDLALSVAQDPVSDRDSFRDYGKRGTPSTFADDFLAAANGAAGRFQIE